jgi:bifunctional non-homologous end joining protein LigD
VQLQKAGRTALIFGKNGGGLTHRFPTVAETVLALPARSCIIDGELIAAGEHGEPDFLAPLHGHRVPVCVYAFDLMHPQSRDIREQPLEQRRAQLQTLLAPSKSDVLRFTAAGTPRAACGLLCGRRSQRLALLHDVNSDRL